MRSSDLKSLGVSEDEVKAALARERRRGVRRRLVAIREILAGKSITQAARAAKATWRSVDRWLEQVRRSGFQSLLVDGRHGHAKPRMKPSEVEQTRRQIAAALARQLKSQVRERLTAIDAVLSGRSMDEAAASARVLPDAVTRWLRVISRDGVDAAVAGWQIDRRLRPGKLDVDPTMLHELAAKEINPRIRKRIQALAYVAEGMSPLDAAVKMKVAHSAVLARVKRFQEEGFAAFQDRPPFGRPTKLTEPQLEELRSMVLGHPEMTYEQLRNFVRSRFRVRYSIQGLQLLLKRDLAIGWRGRPFRHGWIETKPGKKRSHHQKLARVRTTRANAKNLRGRPRKLNVAQLKELRDYVLERPEVSFWRLHRLVWNRFHVRHSHASLKRLLKSEFGITWTGASKKLGEGLNLAELRGAVVGKTDWRMKDRLRALIELAEGGEPETVARSNRVNLETLRQWTKRYFHAGIEGLRSMRPKN